MFVVKVLTDILRHFLVLSALSLAPEKDSIDRLARFERSSKIENVVMNVAEFEKDDDDDDDDNEKEDDKKLSKSESCSEFMINVNL